MSGVNFDLQSAKRIVAAVKRLEGTPHQVGATPNFQPAPGTSFWAALTGCDSTGLWWDWLAVMPTANVGVAGQPWTFTAASMWSIRQPYTAGWGNAREANGTRGIDPGTVVRMEFIGYTQPASPTTVGTTTTQGGSPPTSAEFDSAFSSEFVEQQAIPIYCFQYAMQPADSSLPLHDHRSNDARDGGFAFAIYAPGTSLPQQRFGI